MSYFLPLWQDPRIYFIFICASPGKQNPTDDELFLALWQDPRIYFVFHLCFARKAKFNRQ